MLMSARQVPRRTFRCLWDHHTRTHHGRHPVCEQAEDRKPEGLPDQNYQNVYQIFYSQFAIEYYSVTRRYSSVLAGYGNKNKHKYYFSFSNSKSPKNKEHWDLQLHPDGSPRMDTLKLLSYRKLFNLLFFTNSVISNARHRRKISAFIHLLLK